MYYHASAGFLAKATWIKAKNTGYFVTWPMLTAKAVEKFWWIEYIVKRKCRFEPNDPYLPSGVPLISVIAPNISH